jgi:dihydroorotate dehydrogenase
MDKDGEHIDALAALGFGFIEVGTTTPRPQPGNPPPRVFRVPGEQALINRLGFNNKGVDHLVHQVQGTRYRGVLGINIGKNADTPIDRALDDYLHCLNKVHHLADYVTINVSSPNTEGLRDLQGPDALNALLSALKERNSQLGAANGRRVPLVVKVAPDLFPEDIEAISRVLLEVGIDGLIATNTTVDRPEGVQLPDERGGLSGRPLFGLSTAVLRTFHKQMEGRIPIIGVGGILSGQDARKKIDAGASLVQFYTGLIYRGPDLIAESAGAIAQHRRG